MTAGRAAPPFAVTPHAVGAAVERGLCRRRSTVWVPRWLGGAAVVARILPPSIWRRLPTLAT